MGAAWGMEGCRWIWRPGSWILGARLDDDRLGIAWIRREWACESYIRRASGDGFVCGLGRGQELLEESWVAKEGQVVLDPQRQIIAGSSTFSGPRLTYNEHVPPWQAGCKAFNRKGR